MGQGRAKSVEVGQRLPVFIEKVAHGGHFIARVDGQVIFVRHAIPGEKVEILITHAGSGVARADAVAVLEASLDRVSPPCLYAHPGGCGGCDFQHINENRQRALKSDVISEQFLRIAKKEINVEVERVGEPLHWRTRTSGATNEKGRIGFYAFRSHDVVAVDDCIIESAQMQFSELAQRVWPSSSRIEISLSGSGERSIAIAPASRGSHARLTQGPAMKKEEVFGKVLNVSHSSFWQSHELAPSVLAGEVRTMTQLGDHVLDLYGGVGLFTAAVLDLVGPTGHVDLVESSPSAVKDAKTSFAEFPNVAIHAADVNRGLDSITRADLVILDPPREGAGKEVLEKVTALSPRSIVYIACDPAALARDCRYLEDMGWDLQRLRAFDLFPMTHHIECVAVFEPSQK